MKDNLLILVVMLFIITSCTKHEKRPQQEENILTYKADSNAVALNNKAINLMSQAWPGNDSLSNIIYDSALRYLDQAIKIDSLYILAYTNKAQALQRKGSFEEALEVLNKVEIIKPGFAEVVMGQGFILEKMGEIKLAQQKYWQALKLYEKRLESDPGNDKAQSDIAFLYLFLEDKNKAIDEIQNLILENPESKQLKMMEGVIKNFDRKKFIEEY
jgi:tetratricopeptide (TPR) repeat protein